MTEYLPDIYVNFRERFPNVATARDGWPPRSTARVPSTSAPSG